jgi:type II secretory pathway pseudopilin PulG
MLKELKEFTSLWDYFHKCEEDKAYEEVAMRGYKADTYNSPPYTFEMAKAWLEKWVIDSVRAGYEDTCIGMVNYLNRQVKQMNNEAYKNECARQAREFEARRQGRTIQEAIEAARIEAQRTGQPVITAQQTPAPNDWITITNTPVATHYANYTINPQFYGTITIDNTVRQTTPNPIDPPPMPPTPLRPAPPVENLWGDIPEPPGGVPAAENNPFVPPNRPPQPGDMTEYGWFDQDIETEIQMYQATHHIAREDAIILVFNNDGRHTPTNERQPGDVRPANTFVDNDDYEIEEWDYTPPPPEDDPRMDR